MNFKDNFHNNNIFDLVTNEENIFQVWKDTNVLNQIKDNNKHNQEWNFLDGPPFVNGNPHHGHLLVSTIKDVLARYNSNLGKKISYQLGFDCHGLPMEQAAEKELGKKMNSDATLNEIKEFNQKCQEIQDRCSDRFETVLSRLGRQFESDKTYYTSHLNYMNALWINFKKLFDKNLIYRGKKVMPYSYGCQSALSNFEANQNYQQVSHSSLYLKFKLLNKSNEYFLVWTTTPWSLIGNKALCLNSDLEYILINYNEENYWIAKDLSHKLFKNDVKIIKTVYGKDLKNIEYEPVFNFFDQNKFITLNDSYVTSESGTGIVHIAPLFGADDFRVCMDNDIINNKASNLPEFLDSEANINIDLFLEEINIKGTLILDISDIIIDNLRMRSIYFKKESIVHKYPFCWRTDTPLIYLAQDCWFLNVQLIKEDIINNNSKIQWFPEYVGSHRFANWIEGAPDWCLSRNRFWGTPIPIWKSDDNDYLCIESIEDLQKYSDHILNNLHREHIDEIIIKKNNKIYKRIDAVFDCWYESGMAGIAKEGFNCRNARYPVDFIAESLDQTRGWFYTLNVLSTALFNQPAFKKVVVSGLILASDGMKMSKRLNNYTPPEEIIKKYGADILRLYLLSSPATQAQEFRFVDEDLLSFTKKILPYFHAHKLLHESIENFKRTNGNEINKILNISYVSEDKFDKWLVELTKKLDFEIDLHIKNLELSKIPEVIFKYIDSLTNIWIKFSRDKLKGNFSLEELVNSINTLYNTLLKTNQILSPIIPFNSDLLYNYLNWIKDDELNFSSVHLLTKQIDVKYDKSVIDSVDNMYQIIEIIRFSRQEIKKKINRPTNSPIRNMEIYLPSIYNYKIDKSFDKYIKEQCNIENIKYYYDVVKCKIHPNKGSLGKEFKKDSKNVIKLIHSSNLEDVLENRLYYQDKLITSEFYNLSSETLEKENYYTINSGIYLILLDLTLDEELIWKTKLALWKREIQELRKELNYHIWDKLEVLVDKNTVNLNDFDIWKDYFEKLLNSKISFSENVTEPYNFTFNNELIKYQIKEL